jgi:hypothetical protein
LIDSASTSATGVVGAGASVAKDNADGALGGCLEVEVNVAGEEVSTSVEDCLFASASASATGATPMSPLRT